MKAAAVAVEIWPLDDLLPNPRNARLHDEAQVAQIVQSIREYGFTNPILADGDGTIIAGHGRALAARQIFDAGERIPLPNGGLLGEGEVPVIVAAGWSQEQRRAYTLADNAIALNASWDEDLLKLEISELKDEGFSLDLTGFSSKEIDKLFHIELEPESRAGNLSERFGIPPFSVMNAREGWWQDRKRAWLALGIQSELGRGDSGVNTPYDGEGAAADLEGLRARRAKRKANAVPGGSPMPMDRAKMASPGKSPRPATDYAKSRARGDGKGRALEAAK